MVASIGAFEGEIGKFILALFDANIQQISEQKNHNKSLLTLKRVVKNKLHKISQKLEKFCFKVLILKQKLLKTFKD